MFEGPTHDLLERPLPVSEPGAAGARHAVKLLVGQFSQKAEGAPPSRQSIEQSLKIDVVRPVVILLPAPLEVVVLAVALLA
ncbi:MAG: hypothetical protein DLM63_11725, partial [Solirubrobacterales bacterium]